jgi:hypothetical protein
VAERLEESAAQGEGGTTQDVDGYAVGVKADGLPVVVAVTVVELIATAREFRGELAIGHGIEVLVGEIGHDQSSSRCFSGLIARHVFGPEKRTHFGVKRRG